MCPFTGNAMTAMTVITFLKRICDAVEQLYVKFWLQCCLSGQRLYPCTSMFTETVIGKIKDDEECQLSKSDTVEDFI